MTTFPDVGPSKATTDNGRRTNDNARAWFLGALVVVTLRAIPNLRFPIGRDQATYGLIGQSLWHGQVLYRDLWDNKPPGIFYFYALITKVFGPVMWSVGVVDILWLLAISCCLFWFAKRYVGSPAAAIAVIFNAAWHCRWGYMHAVQPESFLVLFVFLAILLIGEGGGEPYARFGHRNSKLENRKSREGELPISNFGFRTSIFQFPVSRLPFRRFAAGALLGLAFWMKYNALAFFPAVVLLPFLDFRQLDQEPRRLRLIIPGRDWFMGMLIVAAGFVLVVVSVLGYFAAAGAWTALKEVQFEVLPRYGRMVLAWNTHYAAWIFVQTRAFLGPWTEALAALALLLAWARRELSKVVPVALLAFSAFASTAMQGRFHPTYFEPCFPLFAIFWGYMVVKVYEGFRFAQAAFARRGWRLARGLLWLVLLNLALLPLPREIFRIAEQYRGLADWYRDADRSYAEYPFPHPLDKFFDQMQIISYLKSHSKPQDEVYVWGTAPLINYLAGRPFPSRFVSNLALISPWGPPHWRDELMEDLERRPPRFIVVARHDAISDVSFTEKDSEQCLQAFPSLAALLTSGYQSVLNLSDFEIYRRK